MTNLSAPDLSALGRLVATTGALTACRDARTDPRTFLERHARDAFDSSSIAERVEERVKSSYLLSTGITVWVVTEPNPPVTLVLLPEEY